MFCRENHNVQIKRKSLYTKNIIEYENKPVYTNRNNLKNLYNLEIKNTNIGQKVITEIILSC